MSIQLDEESSGNFLVIHVSGKLVKEDYEHFVPEFERLVRKHGELRLLFDMTGFHGWEAAAAWEDLKFGVKHFADIERLAMVGEKRWQHGYQNGNALPRYDNGLFSAHDDVSDCS